VKAGKKPFFMKKGDRRTAELVAQYKELKASGQLEKVIAKRRRHNAAKDHRYIPAGRRGAAGT
jgi:ribosomal RNA-processing protein 36